MRFLLVALVFAAAACGEPETKVVDRPDTAPIALPEYGWRATYTGEYADDQGQTESYPEEALDCYFVKSKYAEAIDYCGFLATVDGSGFAFDTRPYYAQSYFGPYRVEVSGGGDANGASVHVEGYHPALDIAYTLDYEIVHVYELTEADIFAE